MARYRVRDGQTLASNGQLIEAGAFVDLPRTVAEDMANRHLVEEVDDAGKPVAPRTPDDLERFKSHERVGILRDRLAAAEAVVADLKARLAAEEQVLADAVKASMTTQGKKTTTAATAAKEQ